MNIGTTQIHFWLFENIVMFGSKIKEVESYRLYFSKKESDKPSFLKNSANGLAHYNIVPTGLGQHSTYRLRPTAQNHENHYHLLLYYISKTEAIHPPK